MNSLFTKFAIDAFGHKAVRSLLSMMLVWFAGHHIAVDTNSLFTFLATVGGGLAIVIYSMITKAEPDDELRDKIGDFFHGLASMIVPGLCGWMRAHNIAITGDMTADDALFMTLQVIASGVNKPDVKKLAVNTSAVKAMIALLACVALLACTQHPIAYKRADGTEVVSLGGSLMTKAASESATATTASGTVLSYSIEAKDETVIPSTYLRTGAQKSISAGLFNKGSGLINATR